MILAAIRILFCVFVGVLASLGYRKTKGMIEDRNRRIRDMIDRQEY